MIQRLGVNLFIGAALTSTASAQLVVATDDPAVGLWGYNLSSGVWSQLATGDGAGLWGLAADNAQFRLFASSGTSLYRIDYDTLFPAFLGSTTIDGAPTSFAGLAYGSGVLYGSRTVGGLGPPEGIYSINPSTAAATLVVPTDPLLDLGGIDFRAGDIYAANDSIGLAGRGLYHIDLPSGVTTFVAFYPLFIGQNTDVDGLAVSGDGRVFFVPDDPGQIGVFNLSTGLVEPPISNPFTSVELFSAGAWAPGLFTTAPRFDAAVAIDDTPDPVFTLGSPITYIVSARNIGTNPLTGVTVNIELAPEVTYVSDTGNGVLSGDTLTVTLGEVLNQSTVKFQIEVTASAFGTALTRATIDADQNDANSSNNSSVASTWITDGSSLPQIRAIYSTVAGSPTSVVPGSPSESFDSFNRPYRSPDGDHWVISALTNAPTDVDQIVIAGQDLAGTTVLREGQAASWAAGEAIDFIERNLAITNNGRVSAAVDTNGPGARDNFIIIGRPGAWSALVREGVGTVPGFPGETWGPLDAGGLTAAALPAFTSGPTNGPLPDAADGFAVIGSNIVVQLGVTVPAAQDPPALRAIESFDPQDFYVSSSGGAWILQGSLTGSDTSDSVVVVNGNVVVQEGRAQNPLASTSPVDFIHESFMSVSGDWMVRASNADGEDIVLFNDRIIASSRDQIGLDGLRWDDSLYADGFFAMTADSAGNAIIGGLTDEPDPNRDAVLVVACASGSRVELVREGSPVDLDGDGLLDGSAVISTFFNDDLFLTDDGHCYFVAEISATAGGAIIGEAFLRVPVPDCPLGCPADFSGDADPKSPAYGLPDGRVDAADFFYFLDQFAEGDLSTADLSGSANPQDPGYGVPDGSIDADDFFYFLDIFDIGCP